MNNTILTVGKDYRITLPKTLRDLLGWKPGTRLALMPPADGTVLVEEAAPSTAAPVSKGQ